MTEDEYEGWCPSPQVHEPDFDTFSAVLGPDGNPLRVKYPRRKIGFDLTPKDKDRPNDL